MGQRWTMSQTPLTAMFSFEAATGVKGELGRLRRRGKETGGGKVESARKKRKEEVGHPSIDNRLAPLKLTKWQLFYSLLHSIGPSCTWCLSNHAFCEIMTCLNCMSGVTGSLMTRCVANLTNLQRDSDKACEQWSAAGIGINFYKAAGLEPPLLKLYGLSSFWAPTFSAWKAY